MSKRIYLASPHMSGREQKYITEAFETNWIAPLGPNVDRFEHSLAEYIGAEGALGLNAGTAALHMALKAIGVKQGDKVFCSNLTFAASCNPIIYEKGIPVFIDSEPLSLNMSSVALRKAFEAHKNDLPKAIIIVHLYGQSADMDVLMGICNEYGVPVIEDAAESLGATYKGKQTGTFGEFGAFSFNGNKIITTSGGGMLVSDNTEMLNKIKFWITQAREDKRYYEHKELGYNYRMSNIVAGIGRGQLEVLDERIAQKKHIFESYKAGFADLKDFDMCNICEYGESNYWLSIGIISKNSKVKPINIIEALEEKNIESRYIWNPMNKQPFYKEYEFYSHNDEGKSISDDIFERGICLPSDTKISDAQINTIIETVRKLFK